MAVNSTITEVLKKYGSSIEKETVEIEVHGKKTRIIVVGGDYQENDMILIGHAKKGVVSLSMAPGGVDDTDLSELLSKETNGTNQIIAIAGEAPEYNASVWVSYLRDF